jgi:hypothetical protein
MACRGNAPRRGAGTIAPIAARAAIGWVDQPKTNLPFIIAQWPGNEQKKL